MSPIRDELSLPVAHSLLQIDPLIDVVAQQYHLPRPLIGELLRAWTNDVYALQASDDRYILKVYRAAWRSPAEVAWEVELQDFLATTGAPVARVVPRGDGRLFGAIVGPEGVRAIALFGHADGAKPVPPFTAELYYRVGQATAQLHAVADRFHSQHSRETVDLMALVEQPLAVILPWLADRPRDRDLVERVASRVHERLRALAGQLDWGICHGDVTLDNLHVTADQRVTFYDFDSAAYGWRAWDTSGVLAANNPDHWNAFLRGYRENRPYGEVDRAAGPYFAAANSFRMMHSELSRWTQWFGTARVDTWMDSALAWLRQWAEDALDIEDHQGA